MALPDCMSTEMLDLPEGMSEGTTLDAFTICAQIGDNWCWAAVSESVAHYFDIPDAKQCEIVSLADTADHLGTSGLDCCSCGDSPPKECDQPYYLGQGLGVYDNYKDVRDYTWPVTFKEIREQIDRLDRGLPLGVLIDWYPPKKGDKSPGGHTMAIYGWAVGASSGKEYLVVGDPLYGDTVQEMSSFPATYQTSAGAFWTETYFTKPPAAASDGGA